MQALERLTTADGNPQTRASVAVTTSFSKKLYSSCGTVGKGSGKPGKLARSAGSSVEGSKRCRVGFDIIRLLVGPDGSDAMGRPVGVAPGGNVEDTVLSGCHQVSSYTL